MSDDGRPAVRVLVVCTANICRSPSAAALMRLGTGRDVEVWSAGSHARSGAPACLLATEWASRRSPAGDPDVVRAALAGHRSAPLTAELITSADLVLTMTRAQRSEVVALVPRAQSRTFPIRYVERLAASLMSAVDRPSDEASRVRWLASELHARRSESGFVAEPDDTVPDPHDTGDHPPALAVLGSAVDAVLDVICG